MTLAKVKQQVKPIQLGRFTLTQTGVEIKGRPSFDEFSGVFQFAARANRASGFWLADLLAYGESRDDWKQLLDSVVDAGLLTEKSAKQYRYIGQHVPQSRRLEGVDFAHHAEVASLHPEDQLKWLEKAKDEGWSQRDLRQHVRASKRSRVISGQAQLEGQYRVWYADPPWLYRDSGATSDGSLGKAERHYAGMSIDALCKLPVAAHSTPNAVLFMWATAPMLLETPGPREVIAAWGFQPKTGMVWDKVLGNFGHYVHGRHEHLIICARGSCTPDVPTPSPDSVVTIRRSDEHSAKPDEFRQLIDRLYPDGRRVELFARKAAPSPWHSFGDDARLWSSQAKD